MTRKEWIEKNLPAYVSNKARGGVIGCPNWYRELTRMDPGIPKLCRSSQLGGSTNEGSRCRGLHCCIPGTEDNQETAKSTNVESKGVKLWT